MIVDANLPDATSFWLSPTTVADSARADQVREWLVDEALSFVALDVVVTESDALGAGLPLIVTINGLDSALSLVIPDAVGSPTTLQTSALLSVAAGATIGVRVDGSGLAPDSDASVIFQARLRGAASGTPTIPDALPSGAIALFRPEDYDGTTWIDSAPGNLYTLILPTDTPPPPGYQAISTPDLVAPDGSFNNHPYVHFTHYVAAIDGVDYTPRMLASTVPMFAGVLTPPIAPRTIVAVVRPDASVGGVVAITNWGTDNFTAALFKPAGDLTQVAYYNKFNKDTGPQSLLVTPVNLATQEVVLIWRTDGTTVEFFIDGVSQPLDANLVGEDFSGAPGFCIGNLAAFGWISRVGWRGDVCFEGVWDRRFTDAEVLSATANVTTEYVTP